MLHRDIKPNNILLDAQGEPHLTDFGLAKIMETDASLTQTNAVLGTPAYMPPEQASGNTKDVTVAADVYALGAVLSEMLTGRPPFIATSTPALLRKIVDDEVRPPMQVLRRSSEAATTTQSFTRAGHHLPQGAGERAVAPLRHRRGEPIAAQAASRMERVRKWARRHPARAGLVALAAASLVAITAGSLAFNVHLSRARAESLRRADAARGAPAIVVIIAPRDVARSETESAFCLPGAGITRNGDDDYFDDDSASGRRRRA